ncbi:PD-(D/E)XK nuclease-like domain-containing protein [Vibrio cholerae]
MGFYRAEQKPKSEIAKQGAETIITYHNCKTAVAAKDEAAKQMDAMQLDFDKEKYFAPKIFEISESEYLNRPDQEQPTKNADYVDFNSNQDFVTTNDIMFSMASIIKFGSVRDFSREELEQIDNYINLPEKDTAQKYSDSLKVACAIMEHCYKDLDLDKSIDIELCNSILSEWPNTESMLSSAFDTLDSNDLALDDDQISKIENQFRQSTVFEEDAKNTDWMKPIKDALSSHASYNAIKDKKNFILVVTAHLGTLNAISNVREKTPFIVEHIQSMRNIEDLIEYSNFNDSFSQYVDFWDAQNEQSTNDIDKNQQIIEAIERRLNKRQVPAIESEINLIYGYIYQNLNESTDIDLLCQKIESVSFCNVLFNEESSKNLVDSCGSVGDDTAVDSCGSVGDDTAVDKEENIYKSVVCDVLCNTKSDNASAYDDQVIEAAEKLELAIIERQEVAQMEGKVLDVDLTLNKIRNQKFESLNAALCVFLNIRRLRPFVRDNEVFLGEQKDHGNLKDNDDPKADNLQLKHETQSLEAVEDAPKENRQDTEHDSYVSVTNSTGLFSNDLLDLPDFDDEIDDFEKSLEDSNAIDFDKALKDLNEKIDALALGESLVIDDLSNNLYHASKGYSKSSLDIIEQDPSLLEWQKNCPVDEEKLDSLDVGSAHHTLIIEPHKFDLEYAVEPPVLNEKGEPTTKANSFWKKTFSEFLEQNKGKTIITHDEYRYLILMKGSVFAHPRAKILFTHPTGKAETSIYWRDPETGIVFKIRTDWTCQINGIHFIVDVKSTPDADDFEKSVGEYRYHVQDAFYTWVYTNVFGVEPVFAFCPTSKKVNCGRYKTRLVVLHESDKAEGKAQFQKNIRTLTGCIETGNWGGFEEITRPNYQKKNDLIKEF